MTPEWSAVILAVIGVICLTARGIIYVFDQQKRRHARHISAARACAARIAMDFRTHPHTRLDIEQNLLPILQLRVEDKDEHQIELPDHPEGQSD